MTKLLGQYKKSFVYLLNKVRPTLELNRTAFLNDVTRRTVIDFEKAFFI